MLRQKSRNDRFGFTLAEVLITLGIIGVVAALTLPSLLAYYQDKVVVTKVKKAYSIFSQAYVKAIEANGGLQKEEWDCSAFQDTSDGSKAARCYISYMLPYIKTINVCRVNGDLKDCKFSSFFHDNYQSTEMFSINGGTLGNLGDGGGGYAIAADGFEFMAYRNFIAIKTDRKEKNILNKNLFLFKLDTDKLTYYTCTKATSVEHYLKGYNISGCFVSAVDWILLYDNLDYMRCPNKVSINGSHSCR